MTMKMKALRKSISKKLREKSNSRGFTLGELLVTILILLLVTGGMVTTVSLAAGQFSTSVRESEAQILGSTLKNIISDELCFTSEVHIDGDGNVISYQSQSYVQEQGLGYFTTSNGDDEYGWLCVGNASDPDYAPTLILGKGSYTRGLTAKVTALTYDVDTYTFSVTLSVGHGSNEIQSLDFQVRNVNKTEAVEE